MSKKPPLGRTHVPHMAPRELCLIRVLPNGAKDVIEGLSPQDFDGWRRGIVDIVDPYGDPPFHIRARFRDARIVGSSDPKVRACNGKEPPFPYEVRPRWRFQGLTQAEGFDVGDTCLIQIGDFADEDQLCDNREMTVREVRKIFPTALRGLWRGRVIQVSSQEVEIGDEIAYPIAVVLEDPRIAEHEDPVVRAWAGFEPPVRYNAHPKSVSFQLERHLQEVSRWWSAARTGVLEGWDKFRNDHGL